MKTDLEAKELHYKLQRNQKIWDDHTCILEITEALTTARKAERVRCLKVIEDHDHGDHHGESFSECCGAAAKVAIEELGDE